METSHKSIVIDFRFKTNVYLQSFGMLKASFTLVNQKIIHLDPLKPKTLEIMTRQLQLLIYVNQVL